MEDHTVFRSLSDKKSSRKSFRLKPPFTRHAISILICAACMLCATFASFLYQHIVPDNHANVALFYILALVIIARWTVGYGYGIACTLFSVIAINYLFTYPYYKLNFTLTNLPTFNLELGDIDRPEYTLEEIFQCLIAADKPCIVAIDEFQQIAKYPEKNIEALLRTHIQTIENSNFIFAGSERHMMQEMFLSSSRPFYHSADILELKAIVPEIYIPFIADHFQKRKRHIEIENIEKVYRLFKGHTFYIQKTFNEAFADTPKGKECTLEIIKTAIDNLIAYNDTIFREILSNIPEKQKELLYAIAKVDEAENVTSAKFIKRYSLTSASSVQSATKKLLEKDIITEINKVYSVTDKFFGMWINTIYGNKYTL